LTATEPLAKTSSEMWVKLRVGPLGYKSFGLVCGFCAKGLVLSGRKALRATRACPQRQGQLANVRQLTFAAPTFYLRSMRNGVIPFGPSFRYNAGEKRLCFELKTSC